MSQRNFFKAEVIETHIKGMNDFLARINQDLEHLNTINKTYWSPEKFAQSEEQKETLLIGKKYTQLRLNVLTKIAGNKPISADEHNLLMKMQVFADTAAIRDYANIAKEEVTPSPSPSM